MTDNWHTITLLFSDVHDSARLWEQNPGRIGEALIRHAALLRQAMEANGGQVFKTVGDLFCVTFAQPEAAVAAATAAQRAITAEPWTLTQPSIRIALHTGAPIARAGDYFGPPVNQVARLLNAAHGGQTLMTGTTFRSLGGVLPADVVWRDLGRHTLRDVQEPVRVYQIDPVELAREFPPLATLEYDPNNLPAQMTSFIGRDTELQELRALLARPATRLITLTGPGGVGKTRLALQTVAGMRDLFADGRYFVPLGTITDPALVAGTIAGTLDITGMADGDVASAMIAALREKHLLLLLDNFEQVSAAAPLVAQLISACPLLTLLITSRQPLRLTGEQEYALAPLSVPVRTDASLDDIASIDAVRLFINRAQAVRPQFALTAANAANLAGICQRLDGLPLAIELAAARSKRIPPERILDQLGDRLGFLREGSRDLPPRQQALRAAIDWSYDLLTPDDQTLFQRLGIFAGGFTLEAAEAVLNGPADQAAFFDVLDGVSTLVDNSLLRVETAPDGDPRYLMLATIRDYARQRLDEAGESAVLSPRHAAWFLQFVLEARTHSRTADELTWLKRIQAELDNLRSALAWLEQHGSAADQLQLVSALWWFWLVRPDATEGRALLQRALDRPDGASAPARADALAGAGALASLQGDLKEATTLMERSIPLMRASGDQRGLIRTLNNAGILAWQQHDLERATELLEEAAGLLQIAEDKRALGSVLANLGQVAIDRGHYDDARALYADAYHAQETLDDKAGMSFTLALQAELAFNTDDVDGAANLFRRALESARAQEQRTGEGGNLLGLGRIAALTDLSLATALIEDALTIFQEIDSRDGSALAKMALAGVKTEQGDRDHAASLLSQALEVFSFGDDPLPVFACLTRLARLASAGGDPAGAARLLGATTALRAAFPVVMTPRERRESAEAVSAVRAEMDDEAFAAAYADGQALSLTTAIETAGAIAAPAGRPVMRCPDGWTTLPESRTLSKAVEDSASSRTARRGADHQG